MVGQEEHIEPGHSNISALGVEKDDEDDPSEEKKRSDNEWLMTLLRSNTFYRIPLGNVQLLLEKMESMSVPAGKVIIRQDDPGDYYYLVREGQCEVLHNGVVIGHRKANEGFGEEALISGNPRNATVRMTEDGILVRLSKKDFNELLVPPLINHVSIAECIKMAEKGAILIDVRSRKEFKNQRLARSINLPLNILRVKISKLTPNKHKQFIVYCDTGARSSAACFLLKQEGFNAYLLDSPEEAFKTIWAPPSKES
jgi:CRP-like cAMP-binding protein